MKMKEAQKATEPSQKAKSNGKSRVSAKNAAAADAAKQERKATMGQERIPLTAGSFFSSTVRQAAHKSKAVLHRRAVCHGKATKYPQTPPMSAATVPEKGMPDKNAVQNGESVLSALS